jgi:hypothetical protein
MCAAVCVPGGAHTQCGCSSKDIGPQVWVILDASQQERLLSVTGTTLIAV